MVRNAGSRRYDRIPVKSDSFTFESQRKKLYRSDGLSMLRSRVEHIIASFSTFFILGFVSKG